MPANLHREFGDIAGIILGKRPAEFGRDGLGFGAFRKDKISARRSIQRFAAEGVPVNSTSAILHDARPVAALVADAFPSKLRHASERQLYLRDLRKFGLTMIATSPASGVPATSAV